MRINKYMHNIIVSINLRQSVLSSLFPVVRLCKSRGGFPLWILCAGFSLYSPLYSYGYLQVICLSCGGYKLSLRIAICRNYWLHTALLIYIYVLIPNPLPSAVALRIELLWAVSSRRPPHSFTCALSRAHHSSHSASAADARADAAARVAVSVCCCYCLC